jgi:hypothetical protein
MAIGSKEVLVSCILRSYACLASAVLLAACGTQQPVDANWLGRWQGPEGTWLEISRSGEGYTVTIRDLDATRTFPARVVRNSLTFQRDGTTESLRATDGAGTGMKWLAGKSTCLAVRPGEGFCRD